MEIIHLRLASEASQELVDLIREATDSSPIATGIRIYRHAKIESDLAVHLDGDGAGGWDGASDVGKRLASLLRTYGMVEHSVWERLK